jgi:hypothetical protein
VHRDRDLNPEIRWHVCDRIEPGNYPGYCRSTQIYRDGPYKRWICALQFDIFDESLMNEIARLTCFLNLGSGEKPRATSRRSKYWQAWVAANGKAAPTRKDRMSPAIFERRHAVVRVEDVKKNFRSFALGAEETYSVVREVIRWETGGTA